MSRPTQSSKICLLGSAAVGKTSICSRFTRGVFSSTEPSTIGAAFQTRSIDLPDASIKLELWDTAGQERYRSLASMYYRGAQAVVVVYDITSRESFDAAQAWVRELKKKLEGGKIIIALAGNKKDLANRREVDYDEACVYAKEQGIPIVFEVTAKDERDDGINNLFVAVAKALPRQPQLPPGSPRVDLRSARSSYAPPPPGSATSSSAAAPSSPPTGTTVGGCCT